MKEGDRRMILRYFSAFSFLFPECHSVVVTELSAITFNSNVTTELIVDMYFFSVSSSCLL
jgi:hypothetical protein